MIDPRKRAMQTLIHAHLTLVWIDEESFSAPAPQLLRSLLDSFAPSKAFRNAHGRLHLRRGCETCKRLRLLRQMAVDEFNERAERERA